MKKTQNKYATVAHYTIFHHVPAVYPTPRFVIAQSFVVGLPSKLPLVPPPLLHLNLLLVHLHMSQFALSCATNHTAASTSWHLLQEEPCALGTLSSTLHAYICRHVHVYACAMSRAGNPRQPLGAFSPQTSDKPAGRPTAFRTITDLLLFSLAGYYTYCSLAGDASYFVQSRTFLYWHPPAMHACNLH